MPIYDPDHVEYTIASGRIQIAMDDGQQLPAYWAHPERGARFPGIALIHDWWGVDEIVRRLANFFAQTGYYVIVPDLFNGQLASTAVQAMALVESLGDAGYPRVHTALSVLEQHHQCNGNVAAIGLGMGGSLAYEAAIVRADLEAAIAFGGFPQRYFGRFKDGNTPILAFYGSQEPYTQPAVIQKLRSELAKSPLGEEHQVVVIESLEHQFFGDSLTAQQRELSRGAIHMALTFLEEHLEGPTRPPDRQVI